VHPREPRGKFYCSLLDPREIPMGTKSVGTCSRIQNYSGLNKTAAILSFDFRNKFQQTSFPGVFLAASNDRQNILLGSRG